MKKKIYEIPDKLIVVLDTEAKVIIDTWLTYAITVEEFREAVFIEGVSAAKAVGVKGWIVDSSKTKGCFSQDIQEFITKQVFPRFAQIGVQYFITINSESSLTNLSIRQYVVNADSSGLKVIKASSVQGAIEWLKENENSLNK